MSSEREFQRGHVGCSCLCGAKLFLKAHRPQLNKSKGGLTYGRTTARMFGWRSRLEVWRRLILNDFDLRHRVLVAVIRELLMAGQ